MEFTGFYHASHHPEAAGLIEQSNSLLKTQCQLGCKRLEAWVKVLQKQVYALNQHSRYGTVFL